MRTSFLAPTLNSGKRLSASLGIAALVLVARSGAPIPVAAATAPLNGSAVSCRDLPIPGALVQAQSCWLGGDGLVVAAGVSGANPSDSALVMVRGGQHQMATYATAGLRIAGVVGDTACVQSGSGGAALSLTGTTPQWSASCARFGVPDSLATTSVASSSPALARPDAAQPAPASSQSYYIQQSAVASCTANGVWNGKTSTCIMWSLGHHALVPTGGSLTILDFGSPCFDPASGIDGVDMFPGSSTCTHDSVITALMTAWIAGYQSDHGAGTPPTIVAASTSNSLNGINAPTYALTSSQMSAAGTAWAGQVVDKLTNPGSAPLTFWGGIDAEESSGGNWYGPGPTEAFATAFGATTHPGVTTGLACTPSNSGMLVDFGDAIYLNGSWNPPGGWSVGDIYAVAYGYSTSCALPEIYYSVNATEWQSVSQWAVSSGHKGITFSGAMSENGYGGTLTSSNSWSALAAATGQNAPYATTIGTAVTVAPGVLNPIPSVPNTVPPTSNTTDVTVSWNQASGLVNPSYTLWVQIAGSTQWQAWTTTTQTSVPFFGTPSTTYGFALETTASGYDSGAPSVVQETCRINTGATSSLPFAGLDAIDGFGNLHPGSSAPLANPTTFGSWNIARGIAMLPGGQGGYILDGFGGLHPFGDAPAMTGGPYWPGWDIARGIVLTPDGRGAYIVDSWGGIHAVGDAVPVTGTSWWPGLNLTAGIVLIPGSSSEGYVLDGWGGLHPFGGAPALQDSGYWPGWNIARGITMNASGTGGYVVDGWGGVHPFGSAAPATSVTSYFPGWDIIRGIVMVPGSNTEGYVVDGYGGFEPFGGAPPVFSPNYNPGQPIAAVAIS